MSALSMIGIASFVSYSQTQSVNEVAFDIVNVLNSAKSKALSQVKPSQGPCIDSPLDGYAVDVTSSGYELQAVCGGAVYSIEGSTKSFPSHISVDPSNVFFNVLTGGVKVVRGTSTIKVQGYGKTKTITISQDGRIILN